MAYRMLAEMRVALYRKLDELAPAYLLRRRSGDLVALATQDVETVEYFFAHTVAPAFIAAAVSPRSPRLGTLFVAAQLVDWGFFALATIGVERMRVDPAASVMVPFDLYDMPYTHSLIGAALWAFACLVVVGIGQRSLFAGLVAGLVVLSRRQARVSV
jgi:ABC-type multidrug transport system fused ATPase/permease subunit